jgi:hypothetical protein
VADIFREVDEDLRTHQLLSLWRKYGKFLIAAVLCLIMGVAGVAGWRTYWNAMYQKDSLVFGAGMDLVAHGKTAEAAKAFARLKEKGTPGYAFLAGMEEAQAELTLGHKDKAVAIYKSLASSDIKDPYLADYAELQVIMQSVDGGLDADMIKKLASLAEEGKPWAFAARQTQAVAAYKAGRTAEAHDILMALIENVDAPQTVRDRAQQLADVIGSPASAPAAAPAAAHPPVTGSDAGAKK